MSYLSADYLREKYPYTGVSEEVTLYIYANFLPTPRLLEQLRSLEVGESITYKGKTLAFVGEKYYTFIHTSYRVGRAIGSF